MFQVFLIFTLLLAAPLSIVATDTVCANAESDSCDCVGTVHYGKKFQHGASGPTTSLSQLLASPHVSRHEIAPVTCSNSVFSDPMVGTLKWCLCQPQSNYTFSPLQPANFTVDSAYANTGDGKWRELTVASVTLHGKVSKTLAAGAVKYQVYQTGVTSFIASGNSDYFTCDNKGCDLANPIALTLDTPTKSDGSKYMLEFDFVIPKKAASSPSNDFRVVFWGQDQDHFPYDFTATLNFNLDTSAKVVHSTVGSLTSVQSTIRCEVCQKVMGKAISIITKHACGATTRGLGLVACEVAGFGPEDPGADACVIIFEASCNLLAAAIKDGIREPSRLCDLVHLC